MQERFCSGIVVLVKQRDHSIVKIIIYVNLTRRLLRFKINKLSFWPLMGGYLPTLSGGFL